MSDEIKSTHPPASKASRTVRLVVLGAVLPIAVLVLAGFGAKYMIDSAPTAQRRAATRQARLVEVHSVEVGPQKVELEAMGTVMAARQVELRPQVSGRIVWINENLVPGSRLAEGELLIRVEPRDFELAVAQRESEVLVAQSAVIEANRRLTMANSDLRMEMGNQSVARRDFEMLSGQIDEKDAELILRKPQLEGAKAEVEAATAAVRSAEASLAANKSRLEQAKLDLARTTVTAPFNLIVVEKLVDIGDTVGTGTQLVNMIGSDEFWVELTIPQSDLRWIRMPDANGEGGSHVSLFNGSVSGSAAHVGQVIRRLPSVDSMGRMVRLLVSVKDPLGLEEDGVEPLLIGNYVRGVIEGQAFDSAIAVPRELIHNGDEVWVMLPDGSLDIRKIEIAFRGKDDVIVRSGLESGERLVTTELSAPVPGMAMRTADATQPESAGNPVAAQSNAEGAQR